MTTISHPVEGTDERYWIYETDSLGIEVPELDSGKPEFVSDKLVALVGDRKKPITDVVIAIHGWATDQDGNKSLWVFDKLFANIMKDFKDKPRSSPPNFLLIGVHWPSAVGSGRTDESIDDSATFEDNLARMSKLCERLLKTDPPAAKKMGKLLDHVQSSSSDAATGVFASVIDSKVNAVAQQMISPLMSVDSDDDEALDAAAASSGEVRIVPDPEGGFYKFSSFLISRVLRPLETIVFGQFLQRSENVGENGLHKLVALLQEYGPADARFHLVSHSLGAPALLRALVGGDDRPYLLRRKVHSATLLQAAIGSHQLAPGGKFERMTRDLLPVAGPIVVTTSQSDAALDFYRFFHDFPLGHHGAVDVEDIPVSVKRMLPCGDEYGFAPGELYNVKADEYIDESSNVFTGSHLDIYGAELMRMMRQAMDVNVEPVGYALPTALSKEYFKERLGLDVTLPSWDRRAESEDDVEEKTSRRWWQPCVLC